MKLIYWDILCIEYFIEKCWLICIGNIGTYITFLFFLLFSHKWKNLGETHLKAWFVANTKNVKFYVNINFMCILSIRISLKFKNIGNESLRNIWLSEEIFILFIFILFHWIYGWEKARTLLHQLLILLMVLLTYIFPVKLTI